MAQEKLISLNNLSTFKDNVDTVLTNYIQKSSATGLVKNDGSIDTSKHISLKPTTISLDGTVSYKI